MSALSPPSGAVRRLRQEIERNAVRARTGLFDLDERASFVGRLRDAGFDVYVLDWGEPDEADADRTISTYVSRYLPRAVRSVLRTSGVPDFTMIGDCMAALGEPVERPVRRLTPGNRAMGARSDSDSRRREIVNSWLRDNAFATNNLWLDGRPIDLRSIRIPALAAVASGDGIAPPDAARPIDLVLGSDDFELFEVGAGHIGLTVSSAAANVTIPRIVSWLERRSDPMEE